MNVAFWENCWEGNSIFLWIFHIPFTVLKNVFKRVCFQFRSLSDRPVCETFSSGCDILSIELVDTSLLRFLESCLEQSRVAPFPIGDGTCPKELFLLDGKA